MSRRRFVLENNKNNAFILFEYVTVVSCCKRLCTNDNFRQAQ